MTESISVPVLVLYTTLGCHLCDKAKAVIWPVLDHYGFRLQEVDIADDDTLLNQYAMKIPVVFRPDTGVELGWPFDQAQLAAVLSVTP